MVSVYANTTAGRFRGFGLPLALLVVLLSLTATSGCNRGPTMYKVRGKVLYKDGSVPKAGVCLVRFEPAKDSSAKIRKGAMGNIGPDGSFELYTRVPGDGVFPGTYKVAFTVCKGVMDTKPLIAEKYANPVSTPYTETIDANKTDLKYEIEPLPGVSSAASQ